MRDGTLVELATGTQLARGWAGEMHAVTVGLGSVLRYSSTAVRTSGAGAAVQQQGLSLSVSNVKTEKKGFCPRQLAQAAVLDSCAIQRFRIQPAADLV